MFPVVKPKSLLGVFAIMVIIFHVASSKLDQAQDETAPVRELEDSEMNSQASADAIGKRLFGIRVRCRCWIGWKGHESTKYYYFGVIRKFKLLESKKHAKCASSCSNKCAPYIRKDNYNTLCRKIGKNYNYKEHKVGCFSKVGQRDSDNNLWDFDGSPYRLCCKKVRRGCISAYGAGFFWHYGLKLCAKSLSSGPIPGFPNGTIKPPFCTYGNKLYACQKPKYITKSVKC